MAQQVRPDVALLPWGGWDGMCKLGLRVEEGEAWPTAMAQSQVVLTPKADLMQGLVSAQDLRPITVLPHLFRTWGRAGVADRTPWATQWLAGLQTGAAGGPGAARVL